MRIVVAGILALAALAASPAFAQSARSSGGNAQVMQQLQQLASERTQLLAENARLKSELDKEKKARETLEKKAGANASRATDLAVARANSRAGELQTELDREKSRLSELVAKFRETAVQLRDIETERTQFKNSLIERDAELGQCVARNQSLYALNGEILTRLEQGGGFRPSVALEPFTRLKRIELENLIDGYQTRAEESAPPQEPAKGSH